MIKMKIFTLKWLNIFFFSRKTKNNCCEKGQSFEVEKKLKYKHGDWQLWHAFWWNWQWQKYFNVQYWLESFDTMVSFFVIFFNLKKFFKFNFWNSKIFISLIEKFHFLKFRNFNFLIQYLYWFENFEKYKYQPQNLIYSTIKSK